MATLLITVVILSALICAISGFVWWRQPMRSGDGAFIATIISTLVLLLSGGALLAAGEYIAGQGDAVEEAESWVHQFRPGWRLGDCQPRDTDNNGYVTCTLVKGAGEEIEPIECGVNRWYHGWRVSGCKPVFYAPSRGR
jgi:hypothetical protein